MMEVRPGYVLVERPPNYEVVPKELPEMLKELSAVCKESGCNKVLVVGPKTKVSLAVFDLYDLGKEIANLQLKIAMVESHDASIDDVKFLETVAQNRGGPLQFFDTEDAAKDRLGVF